MRVLNLLFHHLAILNIYLEFYEAKKKRAIYYLSIVLISPSKKFETYFLQVTIKILIKYIKLRF